MAGTGKEGFSGDGGPATQAQLAVVQGVAVDRVGNLYLADQRNRRVRKVDVKTGIISTVAGGGTEPVKDGALATAIALGGRPFGLAFDTSGSLYIGDGGLNRILKVSPAGIVTLVAGTGTPGFSGDGGPAAQAQFNNSSPRLAVDSAGNLYFADAAYNRIRKVSADGIITTVAGRGPIFPDPGSFAGDGGPATAARLWDCTGVAIDGAGNLYITDRGNVRIRKVIGIAAPGVIGGQ